MIELTRWLPTCNVRHRDEFHAAETLALSEHFDVVLMDIHRPVIDGYEPTRRIREAQREAGRHVPMVAMTACAMAGDREKCLRAGMDDYTDDPINRARLIQTVERIAEAALHCR